jgi:peptide/nickel transport system ATP-binding protein
LSVEAALDVRSLEVFFQTLEGEVQAVRDVSFSVGAGEVVGVVGESGCGKSVTALAIMGLLPPGLSRTRGSAVLGGDDLLALSADQLVKARGRDISMIFQEPMTALDPVFRIGDQIAETVRAHQRVSRRAAVDRTVQVLTDVGIPDAASRAKAYPHQLSGGMRQRVMIADEPTTALDVTVQAQILGLLEQLSREHGTAVVLITHDLGVVAETCTRIHTMYAGEIVEECGLDEALVDPKHPYTSGLIQAIPRSGTRRQPLYSIPGRVPPLTEMPAGCRFQPRCEHARQVCQAPQPFLQLGDRAVRCVRQAELALPGAIATSRQ